MLNLHFDDDYEGWVEYEYEYKLPVLSGDDDFCHFHNFYRAGKSLIQMDFNATRMHRESTKFSSCTALHSNFHFQKCFSNKTKRLQHFCTTQFRIYIPFSPLSILIKIIGFYNSIVLSACYFGFKCCIILYKKRRLCLWTSSFKKDCTAPSSKHFSKVQKKSNIHLPAYFLPISSHLFQFVQNYPFLAFQKMQERNTRNKARKKEEDFSHVISQSNTVKYIKRYIVNNSINPMQKAALLVCMKVWNECFFTVVTIVVS